MNDESADAIERWQTLRARPAGCVEAVYFRYAGDALASELARMREQNARLIDEMCERAVATITLREMFDQVFHFSSEPGPWQERVLDKVYELQAELTRMRARCAELEYFVRTIAVDANDDPELTCVLCSKGECEWCFRTQSGGVTAWYGIHVECRTRARAARERKADDE